MAVKYRAMNKVLFRNAEMEHGGRHHGRSGNKSDLSLLETH
jgi:hypothetical protein